MFGSLNLDLVVTLPRLPRPGETVTDGRLGRHHGGKGGNQAVAAARAGAVVRFLGAVGDDAEGSELLAALGAEGIDVSDVRRTAEASTGTALICVDEGGENQIAVAPGANRWADAADADLDGVRVAVAQLEARVDAVAAFLDRARAAGATTLLNAAPLVPGAADLASEADVLLVNADERRALEDVPAVGTVITTRGADGLVVTQADGNEEAIEGHRVSVVDTVGAGDAVCGALAAGLAAGLALADAARRANAAGALATTRPGARSAPTADEIDSFLAEEARS